MPPVGAAIAAFAASVTATVSAALVAVGGWSGIVAFLTSPFGALVLGIGLQLVTSLFLRKPQAPSIEAAKVNVRLPEPERWLTAGQNRQGGGIVFAEFDADGNFWYLIVHADSILTETIDLYFDDEIIEIDENGFVTSTNFLLNNNSKFQIFTTTHTEANPTPPAIEPFKTAFSGFWTDDHKLVGTTYSAVKISPIKPEDRYKIFRWRGAIGVGEPSFSIVGNWSNVYDPRDVEQTLGDRSTYKFSRNPVLLWAWYRTERYGRNKPNSKINWDKIAEQADICDATRTDIDGGVAPFWQCDISIPESTERTNGEQQILISCDAQLVFDDDGKCWPRVGYYYAPSLKLVRNRDIVAMESVEAQNGESLTQGVIVRYIDPDANYTAQPCAPYVNPFYFVEGETPKYLVVDALAIQNHRQAMQLAKSISHRSQPPYKLLPTVGLRGLKARQERIVDLLYDNEFAGDHEIVTPTEVDVSGAFVGFGCVPIDENRWVFLAGEEKSKPVNADSLVYYLPTLPTGVVIEFINNSIRASFDSPPRDDWFYEFEYQIVQPGKNLFNKNTVKLNTYAGASGGEGTNATYVRSDFIEVEPGETYYGNDTVNGMRMYTAYDENKNVVEIHGEDNISSTIVVPSSGVRFYRITVWVNRIDTFQLEKGTSATSYESYGFADENSWLPMTIPSGQNYAISGNVLTNTDYFVRWRALSTGGENSNYISPIPTINTSSLTLTGTPVSTVEVDVAYTGFTISVTGGQSPYIYDDIFGRLPLGISINPSTGVVSGTPTISGTYENITIRVSDNVGNFKNFPTFNITVTEP